MSRIREYLEDRLDILSVHGDEARMKNCLFCDRARTMKVNVDTGRFICFNEDCMERGGFLRLIMAVEECGRDDAIRIKSDLARGIARARDTLTALVDRLGNMSEPAAQVDHPPVDYPLPDEFIPCWDGERWSVPTYLTDGVERRPVRRSTLKKWGIGYCEDGKYEGRIVVPILCDGSRSFVARRIGKRGPKYLSPGEGWDDRLLFGYDEVEPSGRVVAVEGVFDAMRLWSYGHPAVAYFGQQLGSKQVDLLRRRRVDELVLMPDGNDSRAVSRALKDAAVLADRFGSIRVAQLGDHDPDDAPRHVVESALSHASKVDDLTDSLRSRLSNAKDAW